MSGFKVFTNYRAWMDDLQVFVTHQDGAGNRGVALPMKFVLVEPGQIVESPTISNSDGRDPRDFLQACMDAAWDLGLRPKGFADHTHELTAVRYHLEDMRALAKVPARPGDGGSKGR